MSIPGRSRARRGGVAVLAVVALALGACSAGSTSSTTPAATSGSSGSTVTLAGFKFTPATLTVAAGTTVTFRNDDSTAHTATNGKDGQKAPNPLFDLQLPVGGSATFKFDTPGTYPVTCTIHPTMNMVITVQ